jgi:hypothetical protein
MRAALFWDITRRRAVIVYRRFGTTYRSHLQGSTVREENKAMDRNIDSKWEDARWVVVYVIKRPLKKFIFRWSINVLLL